MWVSSGGTDDRVISGPRLPGRLLVAVLHALFCIQGVFAADNLHPQSDAISSTQVLNLIFGLVVVLAIFFCIAYLVKRLSGMSAMSRGNIKIIDALHLGTRERLLLVKVADTYMVLGISPGQINALHVLTHEPGDEAGQSAPDFKSRLHGLLTAVKSKDS
ncbi:MAG: flagellar biosynthetic protein FliO [Gammaproteobacteria bacterium]